MPRLIDDDLADSYKRVGLLPRSAPDVHKEQEKKEPIVVSVTVQQDSTKVDHAILALAEQSIKDRQKKPEQWEFTVQRNEKGQMIKILAKQLE